MASYYSHYLAAEAVLKNCPPDLPIAQYPDCYVLGAQGGDLLFYAFGEFKGYGARTHRENTAAIFNAALDYCRKDRRPETLSYALGLLCHYALDSAAHPYVVHEAETRLPSYYPEHLSKCLHMMLETRIDVIMTEQAKKEGADLSLSRVLPVTERSARSLADVWYNAIDKVFGTEVPYSLLKKLPSRMHRYQRVFLKPRSLSCAVLRVAAKKLGYPAYITGFFLPDKDEPDLDFANLSRRPYPEYAGSENTLSLSYPEILGLAVRRTLDLMQIFAEKYKNGGSLPSSLFKVNFSGYACDTQLEKK